MPPARPAVKWDDEALAWLELPVELVDWRRRWGNRVLRRDDREACSDRVTARGMGRIEIIVAEMVMWSLVQTDSIQLLDGKEQRSEI